MANLNKVMLMGNLTRDPINKATPSGLAICEFGLAINRRYKTAQGEDREEVCYVDVEAFGKTAELCGRYLHKGAPAYVEGRLKLDQWIDKATGQNRNRLRVNIDTVQFLERRQDAMGNPQNVSYDGMGQAMTPPPMNMPPPAAYNPPPPRMAAAPPPLPSVQDSSDGPPLSDYEEEAADQNIPF
ncbi:MAG: single-stranded DNA-binding protein [Lentisphaeria bacterium]|jgi:single-strand DNA-binding protein|nr:single-stranded DNA-binding protein [Lentisphaeria bacterium]